jgi:hypothetical protein
MVRYRQASWSPESWLDSLRECRDHLVPAMAITPANVPETPVAGDIAADLDAAGFTLAELHIDRPACPRP